MEIYKMDTFSQVQMDYYQKVQAWLVWPANHKVAGSTASQGTCLGCGPGPQLGACKEATD